MRQILLTGLLLLLGISWAAAQNSSTPSNSYDGAQQGTGQDSTAMAGGSGRQTQTGQMTVEGCLSGSTGSFRLTDKNGTKYQLTGDTAKLSEHVGHEVRVTGTSGTGGSAGSGDTASTGAGSTAGSSGSGQTLEVSSVKHISKTCENGGGMAH